MSWEKRIFTLNIWTKISLDALKSLIFKFGSLLKKDEGGIEVDVEFPIFLIVGLLMRSHHQPQEAGLELVKHQKVLTKAGRNTSLAWRARLQRLQKEAKVTE